MNNNVDNPKFTIKKMTWEDSIESRTYMDGRTEEYNYKSEGHLGQYWATIYRSNDGKYYGQLMHDVNADFVSTTVCDTLEECKESIEQLAIDDIQYFLDNHVE